MARRSILAALTALGVFAAHGITDATEKLTLRVTPNVSSAPGNVIVKAFVARDADNRWLRIEAESGTFYRSSSIQLDGEKAPVVTEFKLSNLPGGEYAVSAVLQDSSGEEITVRRTVIVLSRFGEP
ncbi:MAG TPA: hypothetical protein VFV51_05980 [Vicinamibacterales bacterium]|nr:hypothetical protein [Vicinamibacterales bacterium]